MSRFDRVAPKASPKMNRRLCRDCLKREIRVEPGFRNSWRTPDTEHEEINDWRFRFLPHLQQYQTVSGRDSYWSMTPVWKLHHVEMADASKMAPHVYKPAESVQIDSGHEAFFVLQTVFIDIYVHATTKLREWDFVNLCRAWIWKSASWYQFNAVRILTNLQDFLLIWCKECDSLDHIRRLSSSCWSAFDD